MFAARSSPIIARSSPIIARSSRRCIISPEFEGIFFYSGKRNYFDIASSRFAQKDNSSQFDGKKIFLPETEIIFDILIKNLIGFTWFHGILIFFKWKI